VKGSTAVMARLSAGATHTPPPGLRASACCTVSWLSREEVQAVSLASPSTMLPACTAAARCLVR
jgi:hypothetical protein